jgi:hypothetical protein
MVDTNTQVQHEATAANGAYDVEGKRRRLFAEQQRLRALLEQPREELDRVNAEVLRTQDESCTTPEREDEYYQSLKRIFGYDPRDTVAEIEEAKKNPCSIEDLLAELENLA